MAVRPVSNQNLIIGQGVDVFYQRLRNAAILRLQALGLELVNEAKRTRGYTDRTGNLTNSMGFVLFEDGNVVVTNLASGEAGTKSENTAFAIKSENINGTRFELVIVAGMEYAQYVEAKGFVVLTKAEMKAKHEFAQAVNDVRNLIAKQR